MSVTFRDLLPVMAALVGALVGGLVAGLQTLVRFRRDRLQAFSRVLCLLLEIRFRLTRADPTSLLPLLRDFIRRRAGPEAITGFDSPQVEDFFRRMIGRLAASAAKDPLNDQYREAVDGIAPYDPILAYRLSDLAKSASIDSLIAGYYSALLSMPEVAADPQAATLLPRIEKATAKVLYREWRQDLSLHVRKLAWRVGVVAWFEARGVLLRQDQPAREDFDRLFEEVLAIMGWPPRAT